MEFSNITTNEYNSLAGNGFDTRVPMVNERYRYSDKFGGQDNRGNVARIRLLNVSGRAASRTGSFENKILKEIGGANSNGMASFLIQAVSMQDTEKSMVMQTFGDDSAVYFFGRSPRMMSVSGVLLDDGINNWFYKFMVAYDKLLRGTRVARNFRLIGLELPNAVATGVIMDMSYDQNANNDAMINFRFTFLVKNYEPLTAKYASGSTTNEFSGGGKSLLTSEIKTLSVADISRATQVIQGSGGLDSFVAGLGAEAAFSNGEQNIRVSTSESEGDLYANIVVVGASAGEVFLSKTATYRKKQMSLFGNDDQSKGSGFFLAVTDFYKTTLAKVRSALSFVGKFLSRIETALKDVTNFFDNVASGIRGFADTINSAVRAVLAPVSSLMNAANSLMDSIRGVVAAVMSVRDAVLRPLFSIAQDFNMLRANFRNTRALVVNLPQTLSAKVSGLISKAKFENGACLGSLSSGVTSDEAMAVLALINVQTVDTMGELRSETTQMNNEDRVYLL